MHPKLPHIVESKLVSDDIKPVGFRGIKILVIDREKVTSNVVYSDSSNWLMPKKCIAEFSRAGARQWNVVKDLEPDMEKKVVTSIYVLDYLNKKLRAMNIKYAWLELDIIDALDGDGWLEIPRKLMYSVQICGKFKYSVKALNNDEGIDGIGDVVKKNIKGKSGLHKGMRGHKKVRCVG